MHPSTSWPFHELHAALSERVAARSVKAVVAPDTPNLVLYCYTHNAVFDRLWDPIVELARGLVLDHARGCVVARPFPKFFNYGERTTTLPDEPFDVLEKLDGSLGIVFHDGAMWRCVTKGSFVAEQAAWAMRWLSAREHRGLRPGTTYLFEVIYNENRNVVRYDFENLVVLGGYDEHGHELTFADLDDLATALQTRRCATLTYASVSAALAAADAFTSDVEGFVVRFHSGYRVKIKGAEYLRIHRLINRVTPIALWEALAAGDDLNVVRRDIPEEFWADFDAIRELLQTQAATAIAAVNDAVVQLRDLDDKALGLRLPTLVAPVNTFIFLARRDPAGWMHQARTRHALFRTLRPTNNVLAGYVPSEQLARVHSETG
jgi:RNA ligase